MTAGGIGGLVAVLQKTVEELSDVEDQVNARLKSSYYKDEEGVAS